MPRSKPKSKPNRGRGTRGTDIVLAGEIARRVQESSEGSGTGRFVEHFGEKVTGFSHLSTDEKVKHVRELSRRLAEEVNPQTLEAMRLENIELQRQVRVLTTTVQFMWSQVDNPSTATLEYLSKRRLDWYSTADQIITANVERDRLQRTAQFIEGILT